MKLLRYGIMSASSIAPRFIAAVRATGAGEIVALSSRTMLKAQEKAKAWNVPKAYGSHCELLNDPAIDIVYISSVNSQHYPMAKQALLAGKHVVCEKPCTVSSAQTEELFALAREKNLFLMEAQKMLLLPVMDAVRCKLKDGCIGNVHLVQMSHSFSAGYNNWQFDKALGGGTLLSSGIYAVELLQWLFGEIKQIHGVKSANPDGTEWQYILSGRTEGGVLFSVKNSTKVSLDNTCYIYGTEGYIEIPEYWKARRAILHINGKEPEILSFPCEFELIYEARHVADCIESGWQTSPIVTPALTLAGIRTLENVMANW